MNADGIQRPWVEPPPHLASLFERESASGVQLHVVKRLYRALGGQAFDSVHDQTVAALSEWVDREQLLAAGEIYNRCIDTVGIASVELSAAGRGKTQWAHRAMKPRALDAAINAVATTIPERITAKYLSRALRGRRPPESNDAAAFCERIRIDMAGYERACQVYEHALFLYRGSPALRSYRRGHRRRRQTFRMSLVLPNALARRLPLIFNNQRVAGISGSDPYGQLECSEPLRSGAIGLLAYMVGVAANPERFARYRQVDDDGWVFSSQTRIYQNLAAVAPDAEPGGAGHKCVVDWIDQLARLEIGASVSDSRGLKARGHVKVDMSIPSSPIETIEKLVDDDDELLWVDWSDPRSPTRRAELTLRFRIAAWVRDRVAAGDRVYFDPGVWRCLSPAARALYLETQGRVARTSDKVRHKFVEWYAADPWAMRFGLESLSDTKREAIILAALHELYKTDERVVGYAEPWHGTNSSAKTYRVYVEGRSMPTTAARQRIRRADYLLQLQLHAEGGRWPGRLGAKATANAPPDTS